MGTCTSVKQKQYIQNQNQNPIKENENQINNSPLKINSKNQIVQEEEIEYSQEHQHNIPKPKEFIPLQTQEQEQQKKQQQQQLIEEKEKQFYNSLYDQIDIQQENPQQFEQQEEKNEKDIQIDLQLNKACTIPEHSSEIPVKLCLDPNCPYLSRILCIDCSQQPKNNHEECQLWIKYKNLKNPKLQFSSQKPQFKYLNFKKFKSNLLEKEQIELELSSHYYQNLKKNNLIQQLINNLIIIKEKIDQDLETHNQQNQKEIKHSYQQIYEELDVLIENQNKPLYFELEQLQKQFSSFLSNSLTNEEFNNILIQKSKKLGPQSSENEQFLLQKYKNLLNFQDIDAFQPEILEQQIQNILQQQKMKLDHYESKSSKLSLSPNKQIVSYKGNQDGKVHFISFRTPINFSSYFKLSFSFLPFDSSSSLIYFGIVQRKRLKECQNIIYIHNVNLMASVQNLDSEQLEYGKLFSVYNKNQIDKKYYSVFYSKQNHTLQFGNEQIFLPKFFNLEQYALSIGIHTPGTIELLEISTEKTQQLDLQQP